MGQTQHKRSEPDATSGTPGMCFRRSIAAVIAAAALLPVSALGAAPAATFGPMTLAVSESGGLNRTVAPLGGVMRGEDWIQEFNQILAMLCMVVQCEAASGSPAAEAALCASVDSHCRTYETNGLRENLGPVEVGSVLAALPRLIELTKCDPGVLGEHRRERLLNVVFDMEAELIQMN